jgi:hypothetical protein
VPLSKKKQEKADRAKRVAFVMRCAITKSEHDPFGDSNWDAAARQYIETGDEKYKSGFPTHIRR